MSSETPQAVLDGDGDPAAAIEVERLLRLAKAAIERNAQLEHALESRIVIEQAKGVLSERLSIRPDEAFEILRRAARNHRIRIRDLAGRVVDERATPFEVIEVLGRQP